jgi:sentrin-specific protease 1
VVLPQITTEIETIINSALSSRDWTELTTTITGKDIKTLLQPNWLNDEVINSYLKLLVERGGTEKFPKVYAFTTFFYSTYRDKGYKRIARWTKNVDIFEHQILFIPVHLGKHWCLAVIDLKKKIISYYDSMGEINKQCTDLLSSYLKKEHIKKKGSMMNMTEWVTRTENCIPQQSNEFDCGMFICKYAEYISRKAKINFDQQDMPYYRRRMVYEIVKNRLMYP